MQVSIINNLILNIIGDHKIQCIDLDLKLKKDQEELELALTL